MHIHHLMFLKAHVLEQQDLSATNMHIKDSSHNYITLGTIAYNFTTRYSPLTNTILLPTLSREGTTIPEMGPTHHSPKTFNHSHLKKTLRPLLAAMMSPVPPNNTCHENQNPLLPTKYPSIGGEKKKRLKKEHANRKH